MSAKIKLNYKKIFFSNFSLAIYALILFFLTRDYTNKLKCKIKHYSRLQISIPNLIQIIQNAEIEIETFYKNYYFKKYKKDRVKKLKKEICYKKTLVINYEKLTKEKVVNRLNKDLFFINKLIETLIYQRNQEILNLLCQIRANIISSINHIENSKLAYE